MVKIKIVEYVNINFILLITNLVSMECVEHTQRLIAYHVVAGFLFACWLLVVYRSFYSSFL